MTVQHDRWKEKAIEPSYALWKMYHPEDVAYAFRATTRHQANNWQKKTRKELGNRIGFQDLPRVSLLPKQLEHVDKGDYVRQKILLRTSQYTLMLIYILLPKNAGRLLPVVLAFHGHGYGVNVRWIF